MDWQGIDYNQIAALQRAMGAKALAQLTLTGDERVLDVGCGDGTITAEIAARTPRGSVVGVDPSHDMVAFAAAKFGPPTHANLHFAIGSAERLPFQGEFDLVTSFNALHWVSDPKSALASIRRALPTGGRAYLRLVSHGPRESLEDVIEEVRKRPRWAEHFAGFKRPYVHLPPDDYCTLAEAVGFGIVRFDVEDEAWDFESRGNFMAFAWATFVAWTGRLPKISWSDFIADVLDRYQEIAAENPHEASTFKFYQMTVELAAE